MATNPPAAGNEFPPLHEHDVRAYDPDDVVTGYRQFSPTDPMPGANHAPAYRWGWQNALRDRLRVDDGFDAMRRLVVISKRAGTVASVPQL